MKSTKSELDIKRSPRILLIGAGRFGQHHLRILKDLHNEKKIVFFGAVVRSEKSRRKIEKEQGIRAYREEELTPALLKKVDAVDIVTPPETHFDIASLCLKYVDVFMEKPMATSAKQADKLNTLAKKHKRKLIIGHIFRYDTLTEELKKILKNKSLPQKISGSFINPIDSDTGREPSSELLHLFDIVDFIWQPAVVVSHSRSEGRLSFINIRYEGGCDGNFVLGWRGDEKKRNISFIYKDLSISADYISRKITVIRKNKEKIYEYPLLKDLIRTELLEFLKALDNQKTISVTDGLIGSKIVSIAESAIPERKQKPKVAIIGGGIFGTNIACELASFCDVTLFEKNSDIMQEATLVNCFRHHSGYHYPRSVETVRDIQVSRSDFENVFKNAIDYFPTYYGLAKKDSLVSTKDFVKFCKVNNLPYEKKFPNNNVFNKDEIDLSIKADEASYNHGRLKDIVEKRISSLSNIKVLYNTEVVNTYLTEKGKKKVVYIQNGKEKIDEFDFFINATYANINRIASWMNFDPYPIRVDLAEILVLKLPIDPISVTIIDGPFATLMSTGNPNEFTLYHVVESILDRYVPKKGLLKGKNKRKTNANKILKESLKWFPVLKDAKVIGSRVVNRGVLANVEHSDARVAEIINHGFGCWSILSGKILSSVTISKRLAEIIRASKG